MTYVKLANLAVFMLTTFCIQTKNVEARHCARYGMPCAVFESNPCGNSITCQCVSLYIFGMSCIDYTGDGL
ncbi:leginsulin related MtN11/16/17 family [Medicago truncatula]|uniref:Leginsulin related MtN11/16/17 family n=1 Tax=Medicago truncatula TaxID=3880 RepID=A0A072UEI8_MEDTR|nr:leginsulin related MtN11/16/17 family [Medicago truncatula]